MGQVPVASFEHVITFTQAITPSFNVAVAGPPAVGGEVWASPDLMVHLVDDQLIDNGQNFLGAVNQNFILAALATISLTAGVSLVLSQRIISPVEQLTQAARRLERGDLSQRVPIQGRDELGKLAYAFNAMADGLQNQERLRRNMVSDIAHELRTPLTNLRGYIEALQDGLVLPNADTLDSLHEEVLLLSRLINDLQELSLAEAGQLRLHQQRLEIPTVVEAAISSFKWVAQEKEIALQIASFSTLPAVFADPERVAQIVRNLLHNALTHTPAGGEVSLQLAHKRHEVEVAVYNSGEAIDPQHLPHLFDRFYRADKSRTRSTGGSGLGLAIVKALVEMQHGRVWVESRPGQGTTFFFTLPLA
jgi:signal transduction histidine kinase